MEYRHRFRVAAPVAAVEAFHRQPASLVAITPPPVAVRLESAGSELRAGDELPFSLNLGPLSMPWLARIEDVGPNGFMDRQLRGPFSSWTHRHTFLGLGGAGTEVRDHVEVSLQPHPLWGPVGLLIWLSLPLLFAYRSWATRRRLHATLSRSPAPPALVRGGQHEDR